MRFPLWAKVLLWLEVPMVFLLNIWLTPYAILVAWGVPILWDRWVDHLELMEEMAYLKQAPVAQDEGH